MQPINPSHCATNCTSFGLNLFDLKHLILRVRTVSNRAGGKCLEAYRVCWARMYANKYASIVEKREWSIYIRKIHDRIYS